MFFDRLIRQIYLGLVRGHPTGAPTAARVLGVAAALGLLPFATLRRETLTYLLLVGEPNSTLFREAAAHYGRRPGAGLTVGRNVFDATPRPTLPKLIEAHSPHGNPLRQALLFDAVVAGHVRQMLRFLTRHNLTDVSTEWPVAVGHLYQEFLNDPITSRPRGFECRLYRRILSGLPAASRSPVWPSPAPAWHSTLCPDEAAFLRAAHSLSPAERTLCLLFFYGELNAGRIACVLRSHRPGLDRRRVGGESARILERLLHLMARGRGNAHP